MITLIADNRYVKIKGASKQTIRELERATSYLVAGHRFSPAFRRRRWDGREHLLKYSSKGYRAPAGLMGDIETTLFMLREKYTVSRVGRRPDKVPYIWNPKVRLRDYQVKAVNAITTDEPKGRGILKMPIRSGKTKTAAGVIHKLGARTLFIVPSQMLLHQTAEALEEALQCDVGLIGDSNWTEDEVTVATIQTLAKHRGGERLCKGGAPCVCGRRKCKGGATYIVKPTDDYKRIIKTYDLVVFDECHHLRGEKWHKVYMDFDAPYRIGLSATAFLDNDTEQEKGVIWLKACCGDVRVDIPTSQLIEDGWLMRQNVELYRCSEPDGLQGHRWSVGLRDRAICENEWRNNRITDLAKAKVEAGLSVLVVSNRLNQTYRLKEMMEDAGLIVASVTGRETSEMRRTLVEAFVEGTLQVLIGTVFGEGVDIPRVECVINAEGGKDVKATIQRMRNLTPAAGKTHAVFVDFVDTMNEYFAAHSVERLRTYRSEPAFSIKIMD